MIKAIVRSSVLSVACACASAFLFACGGGAPEPQTPATPTATAPTASAPTATAPTETPAPAAWKDELSKKEKMAFMKANVQPHMSKLFQAFDGKKYANFGCETCHGPNWKDPDDFLPKLVMKDGKITAFAEKPELAKFMSEKVAPEMATLFGKQPWSPSNPKGFGCGGCHKIEMK